jgi:general secretion pathway protein G
MAGFTLIELLVVMLHHRLAGLTGRAADILAVCKNPRDAVLKENLTLMRDALDKYYGDNDKYPAALDELVSRKYLRNIPRDPVTESATTWIIVPPEDPEKGGVYRCAQRLRRQRPTTDTPYKEW